MQYGKNYLRHLGLLVFLEAVGMTASKSLLANTNEPDQIAQVFFTDIQNFHKIISEYLKLWTKENLATADARRNFAVRERQIEIDLTANVVHWRNLPDRYRNWSTRGFLRTNRVIQTVFLLGFLGSFLSMGTTVDPLFTIMVGLSVYVPLKFVILPRLYQLIERLSLRRFQFYRLINQNPAAKVAQEVTRVARSLSIGSDDVPTYDIRVFEADDLKTLSTLANAVTLENCTEYVKAVLATR